MEARIDRDSSLSLLAYTAYDCLSVTGVAVTCYTATATTTADGSLVAEPCDGGGAALGWVAECALRLVNSVLTGEAGAAALCWLVC
jgi:hypothetical protein